MDPSECNRVLVMKKAGELECGTHFSRSRVVTNPIPVSHWDFIPDDYVEEFSETEWHPWNCTHGDWYAEIVGNHLTVLAYPENSYDFEEAFYYHVDHYHKICKDLPNEIDHLEYYYNYVNRRRYLVIKS